MRRPSSSSTGSRLCAPRVAASALSRGGPASARGARSGCPCSRAPSAPSRCSARPRCARGPRPRRGIECQRARRPVRGLLALVLRRGAGRAGAAGRRGRARQRVGGRGLGPGRGVGARSPDRRDRAGRARLGADADPRAHAGGHGDGGRDPGRALGAGASAWASACPAPRCPRAGTACRSRRPMARTREYVEIVRLALAREGPLEYQGDEFRLPLEGSELGKPLKLLAKPVQRADPDLPRRHRAEVGGADGRDRRRLDPLHVQPRAGARAARSVRGHRRGRGSRRARVPRRRRRARAATWPGRGSRSTSAAWGRRTRTSTWRPPSASAMATPRTRCSGCSRAGDRMGAAKALTPELIRGSAICCSYGGAGRAPGRVRAGGREHAAGRALRRPPAHREGALRGRGHGLRARASRPPAARRRARPARCCAGR